MNIRVRFLISEEGGFGLAEVVVSAGVLSVIALGMASLTEMTNKSQRTNRIIASRDDLKTSVDRFTKNFSALKNSALNPAITDPGNLKFRSCLTGIPTAVPCDNAETPFILLGPLVGTGAFPQSTTPYSGDFDQNGAPCAAPGPNCPIVIRTTFTCPVPCTPGSQVFQIGYTIDGAPGVKTIRHIDTVGRTFEAMGPSISSANPSSGTANTLVKWDVSGSNFGSSQVVEDSSGRVGILTGLAAIDSRFQIYNNAADSSDIDLPSLHVDGSLGGNGLSKTEVWFRAGLGNAPSQGNGRALLKLEDSNPAATGDGYLILGLGTTNPRIIDSSGVSTPAFTVNRLGEGYFRGNVDVGGRVPASTVPDVTDLTNSRFHIVKTGPSVQPALALSNETSPADPGTGTQISFWTGLHGTNSYEIARIEGVRTGASGTEGSLKFYTGNATFGTQRLAMSIDHAQQTHFFGGFSGSEIVTFQSDGNVGIGTTTPGQKLHVAGNIHATGTLRVDGLSSVGGFQYACYNPATGAFGYSPGVDSCQTSDRRLKTDIRNMEPTLDKLALLRPVTYHWRDASRGTAPQLGLIAQEVEEVFPQVVATASNGYKVLGYQLLVAPIIHAINELHQKVVTGFNKTMLFQSKQDQEITRLTAENDAKDQKIRSLEERLQKIEQRLLGSE